MPGFLVAVVLADGGAMRAEAQVVADAVKLSDGGREVTFDIARDEIAVRAPGSGWRVERIPLAPNAEAARARASARAVALPGSAADLVLYESGKPRGDSSRRVVTKRMLVKLRAHADPNAVAAEAGLANFSQIDFAPGFIVLDMRGAGDALAKAPALAARADVEYARPLLARTLRRKFTPSDPLYAHNAANPNYQWHLRNTGQAPGVAGEDINVSSVWDSWRGTGMVVGIVDDGVQKSHPDLSANVDTTLGVDFDDYDYDPSPNLLDDYHGTACAGVAAARGNNGIGVAGVAFEAQIAGIRLIGGPVSDYEEAGSVAWRNDDISVKNNSWGYPEVFRDAGPLMRAAFEDSVLTGRGGLGTIHVFAAGNDGDSGDNANYDVFNTLIQTIAVGGVSDSGAAAYYSEPGACVLISAPTSDNTSHRDVTTTDLTGNNGYNNSSTTTNFTDKDYTGDFGGTSSAAPVVTGAVALLLQSKSTLGWRDVQEILIRSARKNSPADTDWVNNAAGFHFNHKFGAGVIDVQAAVNLASTWTNLPAMCSVTKEQTGLGLAIPDNNATGITRTFSISAAESLRAENVVVALDIAHTSRGQLAITLTSPAGTVSRLAEVHVDGDDHITQWGFRSVRHWGETSAGAWTLKITDTGTGNTGTLSAAALTIYGTPAGAPAAAPVIASAATATATTGARFRYQITASEFPTSYAAAGLPAGVAFYPAGFISGVPAQAGVYTINLSATNAAGTGNATLTLTVSDAAFVTASLANALDTTTVAWRTGGFASGSNWARNTTASNTHDGTDAAKSAAIGNNGYTWLATTVTGPAVVRFWWRASCEEGYDYLDFYVGEYYYGGLTGDSGWQQKEIYLGPGQHELYWEYNKDVSTAEYLDAGFVDQVELLSPASIAPFIVLQPRAVTAPAGGTASFAVYAVGQSSLSYQWRKDGTPVAGENAGTLLVQNVAAADAGSYDVIVTNALGSAASDAVALAVSPAGSGDALAAAVDAAHLKFGTTAGSPWTSQTSTSQDGIDAAQSGQVDAVTPASVLSTTVLGAGTLSFHWRIAAASGSATLALYVDGGWYGGMNGNRAAFEHFEVELGPGAHQIRWVFDTGSAPGNTDRAWVDTVVFTPAHFSGWAQQHFTPAEMEFPSISGEHADPDGDGILNLLEYAFGSDPLAPALTALPAVTPAGANLLLDYRRDTARADIVLIPQFSAGLSPPDWGDLPSTAMGTTGSIEFRRATVPLSGPVGFLRVKVIRTP